MSLSAALRIASRVVLPSRVLPVGLGVSVGVLVVVICTNRSVQKLPPMKHRVKPEIDPLRSRPDPGGQDTEERHGSAATLPSRPGGLAPEGQGTEEGHGSAATLPSRPGGLAPG